MVDSPDPTTNGPAPKVALAADLFGGGDSNALDFFAAPANETPEAAQYDAASALFAHTNGHDPFASSNDSFGQTEPVVDLTQAISGETSTYAEDPHATYADDTQNSYAAEGYYDEYGQWKPYEQTPSAQDAHSQNGYTPSPYTSNSYPPQTNGYTSQYPVQAHSNGSYSSAYQSQPNGAYAPPTPSYSNYAPSSKPATYEPPRSTYSPYVPPSAPTVPAPSGGGYSPYTPPAPNASYVPQAPAPSSSPYTPPKAASPYAPAQAVRPSVSPYAPRRTSVAGPPAPARSSSLLSPHLPAAPPPVDLGQYRSPTLNAYDPPVPANPRRVSIPLRPAASGYFSSGTNSHSASPYQSSFNVPPLPTSPPPPSRVAPPTAPPPRWGPSRNSFTPPIDGTRYGSPVNGSRYVSASPLAPPRPPSVIHGPPSRPASSAQNRTSYYSPSKNGNGASYPHPPSPLPPPPPRVPSPSKPAPPTYVADAYVTDPESGHDLKASAPAPFAHEQPSDSWPAAESVPAAEREDVFTDEFPIDDVPGTPYQHVEAIPSEEPSVQEDAPVQAPSQYPPLPYPPVPAPSSPAMHDGLLTDEPIHDGDVVSPVESRATDANDFTFNQDSVSAPHSEYGDGEVLASTDIPSNVAQPGDDADVDQLSSQLGAASISASPPIKSRPAYDPYAPSASASAPPVRSYVPPPRQPPQVSSYVPSPYNAPSYEPAPYNSSPYAPSTFEPPPPATSAVHSRSYSNSSYGSQPTRGSSSIVDPYAVPLQASTRETGYAPAVQPATIFETPATYAPPASQTAADDPRSSAKIPIFHFGFGGKVVSCFHSQLDLTTGFDVSLAGRRSSPIHIRTLHKIIPSSALAPSTAEFTGPLFSGSVASAISIGRSVGPSGSKTKKAPVVKYLTERAAEVEQAIGYLSSGKESMLERRSAQGRAALLRLLAVLVENDGKLSGSAAIEGQIRTAILSPADSTVHAPKTGSTIAASFSAPALGTPSFGSALSPIDAPIATYHVRSSSLDKIQEYLLSGDRRAATNYALDQKMWAHAMVIASSIDKESWKEVCSEFIKSELGVQPLGQNPTQGSSNGRESLRVAYSLFSGQGAASVQELLPPKNLARVSESLMVPLPPTLQATPVSPNFPKPAVTANLTPDVLETWAETAAMIISNASVGEQSSALTALGDYLISNHWVEAAHVCYLLSPQTSPINGVGAPSVRMVLLGSESPSIRKNFHTDFEAVKLTEIVEFALSLAIPTGKEVFNGLPHLQPYKLIRAMQLAELGHNKEATKYCEGISTTVKAFPRGSSFFTPTFMSEHAELMERLTGAPDRSSGWLKRKMSKPSMDSIGSSLGTWGMTKLTRFIEGDEPSPVQEETPSTTQNPGLAIGPFSSYSEISPATISQNPSPSQSVASLSLPSVPSPGGPPRRAGSAMSSRPVPPAALIDRSASATGFLRPSRTASPVGTGAYSASAATTTFGSAAMNRNQTNPTMFTPRRQSPVEENGEGEATWWGGAQVYGEDPNGATPTAASFQQSGEAGDESNFISLMSPYSPAPSPNPSQSFTPSSSRDEPMLDEEDDLGFGNTSTSKRKQQTNGSSSPDQGKQQAEESSSKAADQPVEDSKAIQPKQSSSWLRGWWGKKESDGPAPIKANLGESKTSFYYDKELKRWVNGKEPDSASSQPATPPPPPSRSQTASPGQMSRPPPISATPPPRSQSSASGGAPPPSLRVSSKLASSFVADGSDGPPETPPGTPPPGSVRRPGQRKNARPKYVNVFANPPPSS